MHEREAGVVGDNDLLGLRTQYSGEQSTCLDETLQAAIVAAVGRAFAGEVRRARKGEQFRAQIQLVRSRFAASQVKLQAFGLEGVVTLLNLISGGLGRY